MSTLGPDRWRAIDPYLDRALDMSDRERASWLTGLRSESPELAAEIEALLDKHRALVIERFLEGSPAPLTGSPAEAGRTVGAYTLLEPIGEGGMGAVWLARRSDGRFEGQVAIKFLAVAFAGHAEERFRREGTILARLTHPHIARLIDAGISPDHQPYLVLEYVRGEHIDRYCDEGALDLRARLRLFLDVLSAVGHAHANLVVHRDIKPSNVLVGPDGQVKLLDFGIATLLEDDGQPRAATMLTREAGAALTPAYAAPEQVTGEPVSTATDVYALGVLLYVLLTGRHPAAGDLRSAAALVKAIVDAEPPRPSEAVPRADRRRRLLRGDLDTIVSKALKKRPAERYVSVGAFADDVRRHLAYEPIRARPDTLRYSAAKFVRRNRAAVALAAAAIAATVGGAVGTLMQARAAAEQRDFALRQLARAETIIDLNSFVLYDAAPLGKPFTVSDLLGRAERVVRRQRGSDTARVDLLMSIGRQYWLQDEMDKATRLLVEAYELSRGLTDSSSRALASCNLASALSKGADLGRAEALVQEGLAELPARAHFAHDRAYCLLRGSEVARAAGAASDAVARAGDARRLLAESPFRSEHLDLIALIDVAESLRTAGRLQEATAAFEQASAQMTALGRDATQQAGTLFNNWALALSQLGQPLRAEPLFRRAIEISRADATEEAVSGVLLANYARALNDLGRNRAAADHAEQAYANAKRSGDDYGMNLALLARVVVRRDLGEFASAEAALAELEPNFQRTFPPGHFVFAVLRLNRAELARARGDFQAAWTSVNEALAIVEPIARSGDGGVAGFAATVLIGRAEIGLQLKRPAEAATDAERALGHLRQAVADGAVSSDLGKAQLALARAFHAQGRRDDASAAVTTALKHLEGTLGADHRSSRIAMQLRAALAAPE